MSHYDKIIQIGTVILLPIILAYFAYKKDKPKTDMDAKKTEAEIKKIDAENSTTFADEWKELFSQLKDELKETKDSMKKMKNDFESTIKILEQARVAEKEEYQRALKAKDDIITSQNRKIEALSKKLDQLTIDIENYKKKENILNL